MKKFLVVSIMLVLTLLTAATSLAAVHNYSDDLVNWFLMADYSSFDLKFEGWYSIEKNDPKITIRGTRKSDYNCLGFEYYQNEHNFCNLTYYHDEDKYDTLTEIYLKGSYLFKNGLFAGLDMGSFNYDAYDVYDDGLQNTVSAGYRYGLPKNDGYVAASIDYALNNDYKIYGESGGLIDYELNAKYYTERSRIYGQINIMNKNLKMIGKDCAGLQLGGTYQIGANLVFGVNYFQFEYKDYSDDDYSYDLVKRRYSKYDFGFTAKIGNLGAELQHEIFDVNYYTNNSDTTRLNLLYSFTNNIRAGFEVQKEENVDELYLTAKLKYAISGENAILVMHTFKNDSAPEEAVSYLGYDIKL